MALSGLNGVCLNDSQCEGTLECFVNVSQADGFMPIPSTDSTASPKGFCSCQRYWMWTGSDCTTLSTGSYVMVAFAGIQLFISVVFLVLSLRFVYNAFFVNITQGKESRKNKWSAINMTALFILVETVTMIVTYSSRIGNIFLPGKALVIVDGDKEAVYYYPERTGMALMGTGSVIVTFNITVVWVKLAKSVATLKLLPSHVERYEKFIYAVEGLALVLVLVCLLTDNYNVISIVASVLNVILALLCGYGANKLSTQINQRVQTMQSQDATVRPQSTRVWTDQYKRTERIIVQASIGIIVGLVITLLSAIVLSYALNHGLEDRQIANFSSLVVFVLTIQELGEQVIVGAIVRYLSMIIIKSYGMSRQQSKLALISSVSGAMASPNASKNSKGPNVSKIGLGSKDDTGSKEESVSKVINDTSADFPPVTFIPKPTSSVMDSSHEQPAVIPL